MKSSVFFGIVVLGLLITPTGFGQVQPVDHAGAKVKVLVPDTWLFKVDVDNQGNWEPFADVFGDGTFAVVANTYPEGQTGNMNYKVAFIDPAGAVKEYWAFYTDDKKPYTDTFNETRKDGNPGRVACDRRPGGTMYVTGGESTPYYYAAAFDTDKRWSTNNKFVYTANQVAAVQAFNKTANGPDPLTKVIDPVYGIGTIEGEQNNQMRFGGDVVFLSNGNILVVVEDRNGVLITGNAAIATIFDSKTGGIIKGPFIAPGDEAAHEIWSNVAAFKDGFAVRTQRVLTIYDNAGNVKFVLDKDEWTTAADTGRGDGTRIGASINSKYIYNAGKDGDGNVVLSRLDASTGKADKEVIVNEEALFVDTTSFDRTDVAVDENDNVCVAFMYAPDPSITTDTPRQIVARIFDKNMNPATPSFFAFVNHDINAGYISSNCNVAMDNNRILIAAKGVFPDPAVAGSLTPLRQTHAVVIENPLKADVKDWELF